MTEAEQEKSELINRLEYLEAELENRYARLKSDSIRFTTETGKVFFFTAIRDYNAIVVEYAESISEAEINRFGDGDLFYLDDLSENEMLSAIISEIEAD